MSKVTLRKKQMSKGRQALFLDIYPPVKHPKTAKRVRAHYLRLFVYEKPKDFLEKNHNKQTMELAMSVCAQTQLDVQNKRFGFMSDMERKGNFIDLFERLAEKRNGSNYENWKNAVKYFKAFIGDFISFEDLSENLVEEYALYLQSAPALGRYKIPIKKNTAVSYFAKFRYTLKVAYKEKLLVENLYELSEAITPEETFRNFLFQDELQKLVDTSCESELLKRAALVSALTGLRFSDIKALTWAEIAGSPGNYFINFRQEKTDYVENMPIADIAIQLMGERHEPNQPIFPELTYSMVNYGLKRWIKSAGIIKKITFHCFRHTFATLQLAAGTDIFTVSKLLGHRRLETTLIYVKIVDKLKKEATNRIVLDINKVTIKVA